MSKSVGELRAELKALRKSHPDHKPVSKMAKADISGLIERLKHKEETTPSMGMEKEIKAGKHHKEHHEKEHKPEHKEKKPSRMHKIIDDMHSEDSDSPKEKKAMKEKKPMGKAIKEATKHEAHDDHKEMMKAKMAKIRAMKKSKA